jgi:hypothetical protein
LKDEIKVTVIATGFASNEVFRDHFNIPSFSAPKKEVEKPAMEPIEAPSFMQPEAPKKKEEVLDIPDWISGLN